MAENKVDSVSASDLTNTVEDFSVDQETTEGAGDQKEFSYQNADWSQDYGYYKTIPEFKSAVDTKARWTVGAGFVTDPLTSLLLGTIKGNGKDTFLNILRNMVVCKTISKDSFAEVIRDKNGFLINLKPLDPSSITIVYNDKGRIIRYEQTTKAKKIIKFQPEDIFHLSHERVADEVKGTRIIDALEWLILARNEAMNDWKTVLHRNVKPMRIWYLDSDDDSEIAAFKAETDDANANTENIYVPKGTVETEIASVAPNATLSPLQWINQLNDYFFQTVNTPQIIIGNGKEFTDASGKIVYLSYEQTVKAEQLYLEEQVLSQLNIEIKLNFPASLQNELISSREKDPNLQSAQPNDMTAELEGRT